MIVCLFVFVALRPMSTAMVIAVALRPMSTAMVIAGRSVFIYVSRKLGQGGEHTFKRKRLKSPHLLIYNRKYYLHIAHLNSAHA